MFTVSFQGGNFPNKGNIYGLMEGASTVAPVVHLVNQSPRV